jgi:hypothetical protein
MQPQLIPLTNPARMLEAGLPWDNTNKARWAFRQRHENGLAGAFVRLGRNIFVDPAKAHELARKNSAV